MILHIHKEMTDKLNIADIENQFVLASNDGTCFSGFRNAQNSISEGFISLKIFLGEPMAEGTSNTPSVKTINFYFTTPPITNSWRRPWRKKTQSIKRSMKQPFSFLFICLTGRNEICDLLCLLVIGLNLLLLRSNLISWVDALKHCLLWLSYWRRGRETCM